MSTCLLLTNLSHFGFWCKSSREVPSLVASSIIPLIAHLEVGAERTVILDIDRAAEAILSQNLRNDQIKYGGQRRMNTTTSLHSYNHNNKQTNLKVEAEIL